MSTNDPYSLIKGNLRLKKLLRMSRRLQLIDQKPLRSLFFLKLSFNQLLGFGAYWKTFTQKGQRLGFQSFGIFR
jgi:hypothetical protein